MKLVRLVTVATFAVGSVVMSGTAATAGASGSVSIGDATLWADCQDLSYSYSVSIPSEAVDWDLDLTVINPDGDEVTGDVVVDAAMVGTSTFELCGDYDLAGDYTAESLLTWYTEDDEFSVDLAPVDFTMAAPETGTDATIKVSKGRSKTVTVSVQSSIETAEGVEPFSDAVVTLEWLRGSQWLALSDDDTNAAGRATLKGRLIGRGPWSLRVVTEEGDANDESVSKTYKVSAR